MRLIDTRTLKLHEFPQDGIPSYAILSHRWIKDEVSYQDFNTDRRESMAGFTKIKSCCKYAASDRWAYLWIDTCCIDKTSSSELSESINSMYRWYQEAEVCYAYLEDVEAANQNPEGSSSDFRRSKWFTRGWTLQELLAPRDLIFLSRKWKEIGTKRQLSETISQITGINSIADYESASVAQKLSWVSKRETSRDEDMAYCLLGLFDINMPLLYGEGPKAFIRLQQEILSRYDDESIFAWETPYGHEESSEILARRPKYFQYSGNVVPHQFVPRPPWTMTNQGLQMELVVSKHKSISRTPLNCKRTGSTNPLGLSLKKQSSGRYQRTGLIDYKRNENQNVSTKVVILDSIPKTFYVKSLYFGVTILINNKILRQGILVHPTSFLRRDSASEDDITKRITINVKTKRFFDPISVPDEVSKSIYVLGHDSGRSSGDALLIVFQAQNHPTFGIVNGYTSAGAWVDIIPNLQISNYGLALEQYDLGFPDSDRISRAIGEKLCITAAIRGKGTKEWQGFYEDSNHFLNKRLYELEIQASNNVIPRTKPRNEKLGHFSDRGSESSLVAEPGGIQN